MGYTLTYCDRFDQDYFDEANRGGYVYRMTTTDNELKVYEIMPGRDVMLAESEEAAYDYVRTLPGRNYPNLVTHYENVVEIMDDDLREELHTAEDWTSEEQFFRAYLKAHKERFGADLCYHDNPLLCACDEDEDTPMDKEAKPANNVRPYKTYHGALRRSAYVTTDPEALQVEGGWVAKGEMYVDVEGRRWQSYYDKDGEVEVIETAPWTYEVRRLMGDGED